MQRQTDIQERVNEIDPGFVKWVESRGLEAYTGIYTYTGSGAVADIVLKLTLAGGTKTTLYEQDGFLGANPSKTDRLIRRFIKKAHKLG